MLKFQNRVSKRWLLLLPLLLFVPYVIHRFQKQQPKPSLYIQAAPNNATNPATYATSVAYSPDGKTLACAFAIERRREVVREQLRSWIETQIRFYDAHTGVYLKNIKVDSGDVYDLVFSPDGNTLRAVCEDGFTRWWDVRSGRVIRHISQSELVPLAFSSDGRWQIARVGFKSLSSAHNRLILLRDNNTGKTLRSLNVGAAFISSAAFSADNKEFILVNSSGSTFGETVRIYRTSDFKLLDTQNWGIGYPSWLRFIGNSQIIGLDGGPFIWRDELKTQRFESLIGDFRRGSLSADNQLLAAGGWRIDPPWQSRFIFEYQRETDPNAHFGHAGIWHIKTGKRLWDVRTGGKSVFSIALSPDNSQVAVAVWDSMSWEQRRGHVEVWRLPINLR